MIVHCITFNTPKQWYLGLKLSQFAVSIVCYIVLILSKMTWQSYIPLVHQQQNTEISYIFFISHAFNELSFSGNSYLLLCLLFDILRLLNADKL